MHAVVHSFAFLSRAAFDRLRRDVECSGQIVCRCVFAAVAVEAISFVRFVSQHSTVHVTYVSACFVYTKFRLLQRVIASSNSCLFLLVLVKSIETLARLNGLMVFLNS